jgi:hypothetical protein
VSLSPATDMHRSVLFQAGRSLSPKDSLAFRPAAPTMRGLECDELLFQGECRAIDRKFQ